MIFKKIKDNESNRKESCMIIISKEKSLVPLIFAHIPKTAGGSIKDYFDKTSSKLKKINKISFGHNNLLFIKNKIIAAWRESNFCRQHFESKRPTVSLMYLGTC